MRRHDEEGVAIAQRQNFCSWRRPVSDRVKTIRTGAGRVPGPPGAVGDTGMHRLAPRTHHPTMGSEVCSIRHHRRLNW